MPSEDMKKRRIRPGSAAFGVLSKEKKAKLLAGEPIREGGVIYVIPSPLGKSMSAKKRGRLAKLIRPKPKPEGAKPSSGSDVQEAKLREQGDI